MAFTPATPADLRARFPEVSSATDFPDLTLQAFLDEASLLIGSEIKESTLGTMAHKFLAMHELYMSRLTRGLGSNGAAISGRLNGSATLSAPVLSQSTGDVSTAFAGPSAAASGGTAGYQAERLAQSMYGLKYLELSQLVMPSGFSVF